MAAPTKYPDWATQAELSPAGAPNKVDVPTAFRNSGLKAGEPLPRAYFNENMNLLGLWVRHLEEEINNITITPNEAIIAQIYPVGAIWQTESNDDPSEQLGFGTWELIEGRFLVGRSTTDNDFDVVGETGGSKTHSHSDNFSVQGHSLTVSEMPSHTHSGSLAGPGGGSPFVVEGYEVAAPEDDNYRITESGSTGGGQSHSHGLSGGIIGSSNLPPYRTINIWKRIS